MKPTTPHNSQRGIFSWYLYDAMAENKDIFLLTADLGYKMFDAIRDDFPEQFINCGATEQATMDAAIGLALGGKIPFVYSITPFLIFRPFEAIRTYINYERIPVRLVGGGRNNDYADDGFTHYSGDVKFFMNGFENIKQYLPKTLGFEEIKGVLKKMITVNEPSFVMLKR